MRVIGLCGFAGAGKSTTSEYLVKYHNFYRLSFAHALKEVTAAAFGWPREKMEGISSLDREWRETPDPFWSEIFQRPFTPRTALQYIGTNVFRTHVLETFWVNNLIARLHQLPADANVVVDDVRFINEKTALQSLGASFIIIHRQDKWTPEHYRLWEHAGQPVTSEILHPSEWEWITEPNIVHDTVFINDGSFDRLYATIDNWLEQHT